MDEAETAEDPNRIAEIQLRLTDIDAHSAPARAATILAVLVFPKNSRSDPVMNYPVVGGCVWRLPPRSLLRLMSCCSMSQQTILIWKVSSGSNLSAQLPAHDCHYQPRPGSFERSGQHHPACQGW